MRDDHLLQLLGAAFPAIFLLQYGLIKARGSWMNESLWVAFLASAFIAFPVIGVEWLFHKLAETRFDPAGQAVAGAISAGFVEETAKLLFLVTIAEHHVDARRRQDLLVLGLATSLGFAVVENLAYVVAAKDWTRTVGLRAITAEFVHATLGLVMGGLLIQARSRLPSRPFRMALVLVVPAVLHTAYDMPLMITKTHAHVISMGVLWMLSLLVIGTVTLRIANRSTAEAARIDRESGRDRESTNHYSTQIMAWGVTMVAAAAIISALCLGYGSPLVIIAGLMMSALPLMLGADLVIAGFRSPYGPPAANLAAMTSTAPPLFSGPSTDPAAAGELVATGL